MNKSINSQIVEGSSRLFNWLNNDALPMWLNNGIDQRTGEVYDSIDIDTKRAMSTGCRARVVPRQIYSFLEGAKLGWSGPANQTAENMFTWYQRYFKSAEGFYVAVLNNDQTVRDKEFDLYNQAFSLFGYAQIASHSRSYEDAARAQARQLVDLLNDRYKHPTAGFLEGLSGQEPLRSNPHMHLFEACLAWEEISADEIWPELSDEIANLALNKFIDPITGGLREFFDHDWKPYSQDTGRIVEPGHQFEWAWLLIRWGNSRHDASALVAARRLYDIGWTYGIDETRGITFMALNDDFSVRDPIARLWGQTEWLKAAISLSEISDGPEKVSYMNDIVAAIEAIELYFQDVPAGLWLDKMYSDGTFKNEPAPASSLYHIVCAISELDRFSSSLRET